MGTYGDMWGHWGDICRHQEHESLIQDKNLTECMAEKEEEKKAHTKTAPVYAVKNTTNCFECVDSWSKTLLFRTHHI